MKKRVITASRTIPVQIDVTENFFGTIQHDKFSEIFFVFSSWRRVQQVCGLKFFASWDVHFI